MRLLIDTQAILWYESSDERLPFNIKEKIDDSQNECFVSIVSLWEMSIKTNIGKLNIEIGFENFPKYLKEKQFKILDIKIFHLVELSKLPQFDFHKDPFDRLLIAQAITESLTIISADRHFSAYPVTVLW